eukprot:TRINITY_DN1488_c0_g1_i1.p1 TRINITY_DN1488_c0_g1~~TRINITY_DN1488_c0_g1_i1.p1  ORF type:complete len:557 (+),score=92.83 TRINITY_DN1488_c0_g1_i1:85-1755(+)
MAFRLRRLILQRALSLRSFSSFSSRNSSAASIRGVSSSFEFPSASQTNLRRFDVASLAFRWTTVRSRVSNSGSVYSPLDSNDSGKREPLFPGCDYNHWLVTMEFPDPNTTREQKIETFIKTLAKVVGSEEEAKKRIYALSTTRYTGFMCEISEELSEKLKNEPGVEWVLPDSYADPIKKTYGVGDLYRNGEIIPDPDPLPRPSARDRPRSRRRDSMPVERRDVQINREPLSSSSPPSGQAFGPNMNNQRPPSPNYGPMSNQGSPSQYRGAMNPQGPPRQDYRPPMYNQGPPHQSHGYINATQGPSRQDYRTPMNSQYNPGHDYRSSQAPQRDFRPQFSSQGPPRQDFTAPPPSGQNYRVPMPEQVPPSQAYRGPPRQNYGPPMDVQGPPGQGYDPFFDNQGPYGQAYRPSFDNQGHSQQAYRPSFDNQGHSQQAYRPSFDNQGHSGQTYRPSFDNQRPSEQAYRASFGSQEPGQTYRPSMGRRGSPGQNFSALDDNSFSVTGESGSDIPQGRPEKIQQTVLKEEKLEDPISAEGKLEDAVQADESNPHKWPIEESN